MIILISIIFISSGLSQQIPAKKNAANSQKEYNKEKAEKVESENSNKSKTKKGFVSTKNSGSEVKLKKESNQNNISNEELGRKLNNPKKLIK